MAKTWTYKILKFWFIETIFMFISDFSTSKTYDMPYVFLHYPRILPQTEF